MTLTITSSPCIRGVLAMLTDLRQPTLLGGRSWAGMPIALSVGRFPLESAMRTTTHGAVIRYSGSSRLRPRALAHLINDEGKRHDRRHVDLIKNSHFTTVCGRSRTIRGRAGEAIVPSSESRERVSRRIMVANGQAHAIRGTDTMSPRLEEGVCWGGHTHSW